MDGETDIQVTPREQREETDRLVRSIGQVLGALEDTLNEAGRPEDRIIEVAGVTGELESLRDQGRQHRLELIAGELFYGIWEDWKRRTVDQLVVATDLEVAIRLQHLTRMPSIGDSLKGLWDPFWDINKGATDWSDKLLHAAQWTAGGLTIFVLGWIVVTSIKAATS